jgi:cell division protein FtsB
MLSGQVRDRRKNGMKWLWAVMVVLILMLQVRLWVGEGSFAQVWDLEKTIAEQKQENDLLAARNERLYAEVRNLRSGEGAIQERARTNLGLIAEGETFFLVVDP